MANYSYNYYAYTPDNNPDHATGYVRETLRNGSSVNTERVENGKWVRDLDCFADITGFSGQTKMVKLSKRELGALLKKNDPNWNTEELLKAPLVGI